MTTPLHRPPPSLARAGLRARARFAARAVRRAAHRPAGAPAGAPVPTPVAARTRRATPSRAPFSVSRGARPRAAAPSRRPAVSARASSSHASASASQAPGSPPLDLDRSTEALTLAVGDSEITIETGKIGLQANGAVMVTEGETVMYVTACAGRDVTADGGFVPLTVNYQERFSAAGKTAGGYRKRDGGVRENETLVGRLVDRPLRPMIPKGWAYDTQVLEWVLSYDGVRSTDALAITAASAALAVSDVPLSKPVAGCRVGWLPGEDAPRVNPTVAQMADSRLDLVLAGTEDAVMMIEGYGDFLTVDEMLLAIERGHEAVAAACAKISEWATRVGKKKARERMLETPEGVDDAVARAVGEELAEAMAIAQKQVRGAAVEKVRNKAVAALADEYAVRATERDESPNEAQTSERIRPAFFFSRSRTHRRAPVASHSMRPRAAGPTAEGAEPSWGASNARSAHLGVAPEHFRVRRFARAAHPSERSVDSLFSRFRLDAKGSVRSLPRGWVPERSHPLASNALRDD